MGLKFSPITKIVLLSGLLALGSLSIILACVLYNSKAPFLDLMIFILAPIPNALFNRANNNGHDFMSDRAQSAEDFGIFASAALVGTGIALPSVLYHCNIITYTSCYMTTIGSLVIYISIFIFMSITRCASDDEDDALFSY